MISNYQQPVLTNDPYLFIYLNLISEINKRNDDNQTGYLLYQKKKNLEGHMEATFINMRH